MDPPRSNGKNPPLDNSNTRWITASLTRRAGTSPDAVQIADATIALWHEIATVLKAVIGGQGVSALYDRSITLTGRAHQWLAPQRSHTDVSVNLEALHSVIARQTSNDAAAGAAEFLQTFYAVLVSLIGATLSEQLLVSVREDAGQTDQDRSHE